jgi:hypothetical protein
MRQADDLLRQAATLRRLIRNELLNVEDLAIVEALGFGAALVRPG